MKTITFLAAYDDGLVETNGEKIQIGRREYAVHRGRDPFTEDYLVSDLVTGIPVMSEKERIETKAAAIARAKQILAQYTADEIDISARTAKRIVDLKDLRVVRA